MRVKTIYLLCSELKRNFECILVNKVKIITTRYFFDLQSFICFIFIANCGGTIKLDNNVETLNIFNKSPYETFEECHWLIKTSESNVITMNFTSFDVSPCFNANDTKKFPCSCDFLEVRFILWKQLIKFNLNILIS